jgi:hypothetical protein
MAGAITVAEVITMDGVEVITMDGVIIVAGVIVTGSSGYCSERSASVWRLFILGPIVWPATRKNRQGFPRRLVPLRLLGGALRRAVIERGASSC